jgi:hypothetical protein
MKNDYLTMVFKAPLSPSIKEVLKNGEWSAAAWCHALDERRFFKNQLADSGLSRAEKLELLKDWQDQYTKIKEVEEKLSEIVCFDFDSPLGEAMGGTFDRYTDTLGKFIGNDAEWLHWYWLENDMGKRGLEAGYGNQLKSIATLEELLNLIEEGLNRDGLGE